MAIADDNELSLSMGMAETADAGRASFLKRRNNLPNLGTTMRDPRGTPPRVPRWHIISQPGPEHEEEVNRI